MINPTDKQKRLAQAARDYLGGRISLKELRQIKNHNAPDYADSSLKLAATMPLIALHRLIKRPRSIP